MLVRQPTARLTVAGAMAHRWATQRNTLRFSDAELACEQIEVTTEEIDDSVRPRLCARATPLRPFRIQFTPGEP